MPDKPTFEYEKQLIEQGNNPVVGIDEAGRGPWAGPVVAAAVILNPDNIPDGLNDSKKLSEAKRARLYDHIMETAHVGVGQASVEEIDQINICKRACLP